MQQYIQYGSIIATVLKCYFPKVVFGIARIIIWYRTWLGEDLTISDKNQIFTNVESVLCLMICVIELVSELFGCMSNIL